MGDSIKQARAFMRCCEDALSDLAEASPTQAITALTSIQSGAKLNHARAIYRAAQDAIETVSSAGRLDDRVTTLFHLIRQYEAGVAEMEAHEVSDDLSSENMPEEEAPVEPALVEPAPNHEHEVIKVDFSDEARRLRAVEALSDTLPLAKDNEAPALKTLLAMSQGKDIDVKEDAIVETIVSLQPSAKKVSKITLESFISDVVQQGLTFARQNEVTLSLSYDMGTIALSEAKAKKIKHRMERWLGCLVRHIASQSEKGALAHIDLSATPAAVTLSATAPALADDVLHSASDKNFIKQSHNAETNMLSLHLSLTEGAPLLKTVKTPVEEGIGARLDALLSEDQAFEGFDLAESNLLAFEPSASQKRVS